MAEQNKNGILLDEAYEFYHESGGVSGIEFVKDLENSNVFITGAATKGLQSPGIRVGWVVASKKNIETLSNFSSFGMGGVIFWQGAMSIHCQSKQYVYFHFSQYLGYMKCQCFSIFSLDKVEILKVYDFLPNIW